MRYMTVIVREISRSKTGLRLTLLMVALGTMACETKTPDERGREAASRELGFVEGATAEAKKRSRKIGQNTGGALIEMVRGAAEAATHVEWRRLEVSASDAAKGAGIEPMRAVVSEAHATNVRIRFGKAFFRSTADICRRCSGFGIGTWR